MAARLDDKSAIPLDVTFSSWADDSIAFRRQTDIRGIVDSSHPYRLSLKSLVAGVRVRGRVRGLYSSEVIFDAIRVFRAFRHHPAVALFKPNCLPLNFEFR